LYSEYGRNGSVDISRICDDHGIDKRVIDRKMMDRKIIGWDDYIDVIRMISNRLYQTTD